ncbi:MULTISPECIES: MGDG synthase family glycosyltransferase [Streptomyces]|uniref:Galactosyldiacylglycerol synthase n=2 Tax=Streptomyces albidoflavus TaxID=1886 RepID=A0A8G1ZXV0_9ACTN|nr:MULTISPECIES: galactosyldiacylglycerol synthase [Streptomyces]MCL6276783.1 galactosyldiacylglycerol synthase [Streptomyces albidoflavus]MCX4462655.1 galactosyldiacylglycerol synthase [Streptomyces albidoflavus]RZE30425.1 galactosyldiacylglycerol synthase [Streptomyces albidoflavus]RZE49770.1 galactosyldiacylglycerol synthase [Streptomyces albidoflavus]RZE67177.1 galactosyldiacylglycerol synthase [Streptomyces albidoflavus]
MGSLRVLLLGASMGAGHDAVSGELARRLRARGAATELCDVLTLLPPGTGPALRAFYRGTVRHAPALYAAIYALFLSPGDGHRPGSAPLAATARARLLRRVRAFRPDLLVPTFHLAAQITGRLRAEGVLPVPASVFVTDFAVHRGWLHPGNDLYVCLTAQGAEAARAATGRPAAVSGPVVAPEFHRVAGPHPYAPEPGPPPVLLSTGAWGVGTRTVRTARLLAAHGCRPVLLCGRDERLRRRAARVPGAVALGWTDDMAGLMGAARLLVDNAAGQTAVQALAAGVPVLAWRPLPGHGRDGARSMAAAGLSTYAHDPDDLLAGVRRLLRPGPVRTGQVERGRAAFVADAAELLTRPLG